MALGYAQSTDKIGVYSVVPGPGLLNTTAALSTAYATNARVLCLTGQIPSADIGRDVGLLHEIPDQLGVMQSLTKWSRRVNSPEEVPELVTEAFTQLISGRPRPVGLEIPPDILAKVGDIDLTGVEPEQRRPALNEAEIEAAAKMLGQAENPVIVVGSGAIGASAEVQALAEALQAPVITGRNGRGVLSNRHYLSMTTPAGYDFWGKADVALGIGSRMYTPLARWGVDDDLKIIRIDIDPDAHDILATEAIKVVADSKEALSALLGTLNKFNRSRPNRGSRDAGTQGRDGCQICPIRSANWYYQRHSRRAA